MPAYELHGEHAQHCADLPAGAHHQLCGVHTVDGNYDIELLVRIRGDRVLYRDPPPRRPGNGGRPGRPAATASRSSAPAPTPGAGPTSS
ncbi:hypothetical protein [Streptosporangium sp. CA-115845]|uniref:hypothetical protein n=1 Tax=Streptosporangium sp. CA-115845 TaxID=3240071 RepID=UPI003D90057B